MEDIEQDLIKMVELLEAALSDQHLSELSRERYEGRKEAYEDVLFQIWRARGL